MKTTADDIAHSRVAVNGIELYVASVGPADGPMVVLLHGFPEFSYGWRQQILPLAEAGFRVVVPDQRGYGYSSKPRGAAAYHIDRLVEDIVALVDASGRSTFSLVGHDWGGIVAWRLASAHARRIDRLIVVNAPNLDVAMRHLAKSPAQFLKSTYVALFQLPYAPEWSLSAFDFALLAGALRSSSRPGTFSDDEMKVYRQAWSQPGALTAMLNWYRALPALTPRAPQRITCRTMILWGDRDSALDASFAEDCAALCDDATVHHVADATHWVHHEEATAVNERLVTFLGPTS